MVMLHRPHARSTASSTQHLPITTTPPSPAANNACLADISQTPSGRRHCNRVQPKKQRGTAAGWRWPTMVWCAVRRYSSATRHCGALARGRCR
eukprot:7385139-Prymnesium_polylepis.1